MSDGLGPGRFAARSEARSSWTSKALTMADYLRRSPARTGGSSRYKEWHHFIVHAGPLHLLVNLSLLDDPWEPDPRNSEKVRLIAIAHTDDGWVGSLDDFATADFHVHDRGHRLVFSRGQYQFSEGTYRLKFEAADGRISGELELVPVAEPVLANTQSLSTGKTLHWLFVPRLRCRGMVSVDSKRTKVVSAPAYHDHNWGYFEWGDDFSWEWGSVLPDRRSSPWSLVLTRIGNRARTTIRRQALYLWRGSTPARVFRDGDIRVESLGTLDAISPLKLPRVLSLVAPMKVRDLPERLVIEARSEGDSFRMVVDVRDVAQIILPNETDTVGVTVLNEVLGMVKGSGHVRGMKVSLEGPGVFEFINH